MRFAVQTPSGYVHRIAGKGVYFLCQRPRTYQSRSIANRVRRVWKQKHNEQPIIKEL